MYNCERFLTRDIAVYILPKAQKLSMSITIGISANSKPYTKLITTASPFITSRPMTTVKAAFFSLSTTIQMIATSEIRISVSKYWILSIINQALSKTKELPEIESRYFATEEEFSSLLASWQFIKAVILTDVCRYRFYAIPKLCIIAEFFTLHIPLALCPV